MNNLELEAENTYQDTQNRKNNYFIVISGLNDITEVSLLRGCFINISILRKEQG